MIDSTPKVFSEQPMPPWKRAVLKVGSSLLAAPGGGLTPRHALALAQWVSGNVQAGREVVIVSSGAVAAGRGILPKAAEAGAALAARQALAALGQAQLIGLWQRFFERPVAQVLLTHDDLRNRRRYLNARATLLELLALQALPIVNENDTVSVDELKLGDNDNLAAFVATLIDADALFIASDVAGLYSANPRIDASARPIDEVAHIDDAVMAMAGGTGSLMGTGGMLTKLQAASKAASAGIETVLFDGTSVDALRLMSLGLMRGTRFRAGSTRLAARKHWLRHAPVAAGAILIDDGAMRALREKGASLLPGGVLDAQGDFARGDIIEVHHAGEHGSQPIARGIVQYSARDIRRIARRHSREIDAILGYNYGETVMHRDDLATL